MSTQLSVSQALNSPNSKAKFQELLGKRATQFITSVLSVVNNNTLLANASWESIYQSAITAATLDLPINPNLGFAYIVPYKEKGQGVAQFQMGYKGFIQLAQRTGLYKTINVSDVREGEIQNFDRLSGNIDFSWIQDTEERVATPVVGYVGYIELTNGFRKLLYMTKAELENHGQTFSKSYNTKSKFNNEYTGLWRTNFEAMAQKTVLKLLLSKYAPLSTQMEVALTSDQAVLEDGGKTNYVDNPQTVDVDTTPAKSELLKFIEDEAKTLEALEAVKDQTSTWEELQAYNTKVNELTPAPEPQEDGSLLGDQKPTTNV